MKKLEKKCENNKKKRVYLKKKIKNFKKNIITNYKNTDLLKLMYRTTISSIDKCAQKSIIHKNKAARYKKNLNKNFKKIAII